MATIANRNVYLQLLLYTLCWQSIYHILLFYKPGIPSSARGAKTSGEGATLIIKAATTPLLLGPWTITAALGLSALEVDRRILRAKQETFKESSISQYAVAPL
jgi:hypothetical protein